MWFRRLLTLAMLAVLTAGVAEAQIYPPMKQIPWNRYLVTRIPNTYSEIIGQPGTLAIAGSNTAAASQVFNLALPFNFTFLGSVYSAGFQMKVGANGYISFNNPLTSGVPDLGQNGGYYLIMPYWSDIAPGAAPEGGIYYRTDGATGSRIMTIEWRCDGANPPKQTPGQFQAKLYEGSNKIEFFYSANALNRGNSYPTNGAAVGLKNVGFPTYPFPPDGNDAEKFLLCLNPDVVPDTVALTRTHHGLIGQAWLGIPNWTFAYIPETYANWPIDANQGTSPSAYWHYTFPTQGGTQIGYRFSAVDNDVAADSIMYTTAFPGNVYSRNDFFQLSGRFRNLGANARQNIPVGALVMRGNTVVQSFTGTAFLTSTPQGGTWTVSFGLVGSGVTGLQGTYTIKLYSNMTSPTDQDRSNDTLMSTFYVAYDNDVRATDIIQPVTFSLVLPAVYPVGNPMAPEIRFQNIGGNQQTNVPVGYEVYDNTCQRIFTGTSTIRGAWNSLEYRDVTFDGAAWTPTTPGQYFIKAFTNLSNDENRFNDTLYGWPSCGKEFSVRYEIELQSLAAGFTPGILPDPNAVFADNRPINLRMGYRNNGIIDATNVPGRIEIRKGDCNTGQLVYQRNVTVPTVPGEASGNGTTVTYPMGYFIPTAGPGMYCVTSIISDPQDPLHGNDTARWTFMVRPRLAGTIYVGVGERFRTIQEANDSLYFYGVSGNVDFKLIDDQYTVRPGNNDPLLPALDGRGDVMGSGPNAVVTWSPVAGKTNIDIILKSPSGVGIIYGQKDTSNPTGYQVWDGGANRIIRFLMDTSGPVSPTKSIPFFFAQGASNFTVKNCRIEPRTVTLGLKTALSLPMVKYSRSFNTFVYDQDVSAGVAISSGILVRNSAPADANGNNPGPRRRDTLRDQNNVFQNNVIQNFAYGIVSIGAGPLYRVGDDAYVEYSNQNNSIIGNTIQDVTRAGVVLVYEKNSTVSTNTIRRVVNTQATVQHAAGIWVAGGGQTGIDTVKNRGYSDGLKIDRNMISSISAAQGNGAAIWVETTENVFTSTSARVYRFPANGTTNHAVTNNMAWTYAGQTGGPGLGQTAGIGLTISGDTRIDFVTKGNRVENNTLYNQIAGTIPEYGVAFVRAQGSLRNNIIALVTPTNNPIGIGLIGPDPTTNVNSDYNLFWVPSGSVGAMAKLSVTGFNIPSPPVGKTLNQWRALSGLDNNSVTGNITTDFVSVVPGSENLHMKNNLIGAMANNRGVNIAAVTQDIDGDPRGSGGALSRYDIGADEFYGNIRNNDLMAEDVIAPFGYRAPTGQYSDAEYMMIDQSIPVMGRFRNVGGLPQVTNTVNVAVDFWNGASWIPTGFTAQQTTSFDLTQAKTVNFGAFTPMTLLQRGINDAFYGMSPNVTPIYRFRVTSGTDDYAGNNTYEKLVRFYVRRSDRYALVSVEGRQAAMPGTALGKSNKLNTDTLLAALDSIRWQRADGANLEDYDLFDRDKWPKEDLNFQPWRIVIWAQGAETQGMEPEERAALKVMLDSRNMYQRSNLIIAGQDIARIHDVALTASNGAIADQDFVRNYLRGEYRGNTNPNPYSTGVTGNTSDPNNRTIRGVGINPGKFETIWPTGVAGDNPPMPALVRPTSGEGIARSTHYYYQQTLGAFTDSSAGVVTAAEKRNVVFYAQDWRHYGRFGFEADRSGAQRLLLTGLDFVKHYEGVVPVDVKSFDAYQSGREAVKVDWTTATEIDVASLEIERAVVERSEQGERVGAFSVIERKSPAGSATKGASYTILDPNVSMGNEYVYRLVSVGVDGSRKQEAEDRVKITGATAVAGMSLTVQPNPARSVVFIEVKVPEATKATIELYDNSGKLVQVLAKDEEVMASRIELNVADLASGAYTVRMATANGKVLTQKLSVVK